LKKKMYHLKESEITSKSFRIFLLMETFMYLSAKLPNAITVTVTCNESSILYYNSLQMEARSLDVSKTYLHVLHKQSVSVLCQVLGDGVSLGLSTEHPTKKCKFKYCTINGN
jgi:hypothetical protein